MCTQGTLALELLEQVKGGLDAIIVCVSGGGLISGVATAAKGINPDITILAAEPSGAHLTCQAAHLMMFGRYTDEYLPGLVMPVVMLL